MRSIPPTAEPGRVTLSIAPSAVGLTTYSPGRFSNLGLTVDNQTFTAPPGTASVVQFLNGSIYDVTFAQVLGTFPNAYALATSGGCAFCCNGLSSVARGTISSAPAGVGAVPEPASLALLGMGVMGVVAARRRTA